jgi:hypothetical protein
MQPITSIGMNLPNDFNGLVGPGPHFNVNDLRKAIQGDYGISPENKQNLFAILNSPNIAEQLFAGAAGGAIGLAVARYKELSGTAQALMSLAGFGLGNIIMNSLTQPGKFTQWNPETATNRVIL